jgi:light-regulated signal transduction histidine kinase (bacteriophytochrome)
VPVTILECGMSQSPVDPGWPKVLSLAVHEFRTPTSVVAGYIRMVLKERAGPLSDMQRKLLEEAEKSCGRLSALLAEMSDLSGLEAGTATFNRGPLDVRQALADAAAGLPELADRPIAIDLEVGQGPAMMQADPVRLRAAFAAVLTALRRELITSPTLAVREREGERAGRPASWIAIAAPDQVALAAEAQEAGLVPFDEWRGGCGLSLPVARRVIEAHGGGIWSPVGDAKSGAVIALPLL